MKYLIPRLFLVGLSILPAIGFSQTATHFQKRILDSNAVVLPFAPGIIDTGLDEMAPSFSPDNKTVYFLMGSVIPTICVSQNVGGQWQKPEVASFSGKWSDFDPALSPDGKKLFFSSNRPLPGAPDTVPNKFFEIWMVESSGNGKWGAPKHLEAPVNTGNESNYAPSVDAAGTLYVCSKGREGHDGVESFYCKWSKDHYEQAQVLAIPGVSHLHDPFIAANGSYVVIYSGHDFFVSFFKKGAWSMAQRLGPPVSVGDDIICPYVSHDGKLLYFSTNRIDGFYKRDMKKPILNFDQLVNESNGVFNGRTNILMVPVNLPDGH